MDSWKPKGYNAVSPYLIVPDAAGAIDFMVEVFGAEEIRRFSDPDGRIVHAEVRLADTVVMLGEAQGEWPAVRAHVHVYVPDVDEVYRRALAAGGESVQAPMEKEDEDRRGGVLDPGGTTWWVATRVGGPGTG